MQSTRGTVLQKGSVLTAVVRFTLSQQSMISIYHQVPAATLGLTVFPVCCPTHSLLHAAQELCTGSYWQLLAVTCISCQQFGQV
jgi:hypothetical protein